MTDDLISRQAILDAVDGVTWYHQNKNGEMVHGANSDEHQAWYKAEDIYKAIESVPPAQPVVISKSENTTECEDAVPRTSVEYICRKNTVSTNPYEHKYHDKFIQFMDDPEISDFGRWQHSNGFNTALVAVQCDLDKVPSVTPAQPGWIPCSTELPKDEEEVIVSIHDDSGDYACDYTSSGWYAAAGEFWVVDNEVNMRVVAWCELPKPYWEGGQDGKN